PATVFAQDAGCVGLVEQQQGIVTASEIVEITQRRQVAVHAEDRVADDQPAASGRALTAEQLGEVPGVAVAEDVDARPRQPAIVGGEIDQLPPAQADMRPLGREEPSPRPEQAAATTVAQVIVNPGWHHTSPTGARLILDGLERPQTRTHRTQARL